MTESTERGERRSVVDPSLHDYARLHLSVQRLVKSMERFRVPEKHPERYVIEFDKRMRVSFVRWLKTVSTIEVPA